MWRSYTPPITKAVGKFKQQSAKNGKRKGKGKEKKKERKGKEGKKIRGKERKERKRKKERKKEKEKRKRERKRKERKKERKKEKRKKDCQLPYFWLSGVSYKASLKTKNVWLVVHPRSGDVRSLVPTGGPTAWSSA